MLLCPGDKGAETALPTVDKCGYFAETLPAPSLLNVKEMLDIYYGSCLLSFVVSPPDTYI